MLSALLACVIKTVVLWHPLCVENLGWRTSLDFLNWEVWRQKLHQLKHGEGSAKIDKNEWNRMQVIIVRVR
jgi:hypothetical protein